MFKAKLITVGSNSYLGVLLFNDNNVIVSQSQPLSSTNVTIKDVADYMVNQNSGNLTKDITITGSAAVYSESELSDDLQDDIRILEAKFAKAAKNAVPNLINQKFLSSL